MVRKRRNANGRKDAAVQLHLVFNPPRAARTPSITLPISNAGRSTMRLSTRKLDFILIGAQKSGTTALHSFLEKRPEITMGDQQEMHFFDNEEIFARPVDYEMLHRHFPGIQSFAVAGECTPSYLYWSPAAERIREYNPNVKLLVLLRNPIDRAFAHWNMQRFKRREPLDFLDAIKQEPGRIASPLSLESRRFSYVDRGFYSYQLKRYFELFTRAQIMIIKFEDFRNRQLETLNAVFAFLEVKPVKSVRSKDRNVVPYEREMNPDERRELLHVFEAEIDELEQLLGWDCSDWKR
jgi:hypothetical protein